MHGWSAQLSLAANALQRAGDWWHMFVWWMHVQNVWTDRCSACVSDSRAFEAARDRMQQALHVSYMLLNVGSEIHSCAIAAALQHGPQPLDEFEPPTMPPF